MQDFLKDIIREAGDIAKGYYKNGFTQSFKSSPTDILTEADLAVSNFLINKIKEKYPDHGIISEEEKDEINPGAEYTWVIDPIEGTRNFARHIPIWCTMVGVTKNGEPYLGAVYDAMNDELFFAEVGKGAYLNDIKIMVGDQENIDHGLMVFENGIRDSTSPYDSGDLYYDYKRFWNNLAGDKGFTARNYGIMLSACYLANGRVDMMLCNCGLYHDYLAPYVIVTEAGGVWTNSKGESWKKGETDIVVANSKLHPKLLKLFTKNP